MGLTGIACADPDHTKNPTVKYPTIRRICGFLVAGLVRPITVRSWWHERRSAQGWCTCRPNIVRRQASKTGSGSRVPGGFGRQRSGFLANFRTDTVASTLRKTLNHLCTREYNSMDVRSDPIESAKSHFFDTSSWGDFCDVTLTIKQSHQPESGGWAKIDDYQCREAFQHFMNLLNRAVFGPAFRRHGKRLRVLPVLEKGEVRARALRSWECGISGRWHIHCAIELPLHFDAVGLEKLIRECWAKVAWGHSRILVRDGANAGWITAR
jgi:hypothetical protein